ncbi:MAG: ABC transporter permease [Paracoccaceae bacterium]
MSAAVYPTDHLAAYAGRLAALMRRERQTRYAGGALGYLWAYLTPLFWIAFVVAAFAVLQRVPPVAGAPALFVATGILPYILFRQTIASMARSLKAGRRLLVIRPIEFGDLMMASALLELLNFIVLTGIIFAGLTLVLDLRAPPHIERVVLGLVLAWLLGASFGRFTAVLGLWSDSFARAVPIVLRPMFWASGVFYAAVEMPASAQDWLWFSPLFHAVEIMRSGYFLGYHSQIAQAWYPLAISAGFFLCSWAFERWMVRRGDLQAAL